MAEPNNPAARLHGILIHAKPLQNSNALSAWSKLLSVPEDNKAELVRRLGLVLSLPAQIRELIERIPDIDTTVYLKWIPEVEEGFGKLNLSRSFNEFTNPISDKALHGIEFCSELLSRTFPEKILSRDEMSRLDTDVLELIDRVMNSKMDEGLKRFVLDKLYLVHQSIQDYDLAGPSPLHKAVEATLGAVVLDQKIYETLRHSDIKNDFWSIIHRAASIVTLIVGTAQLHSGVAKLLPEFAEAEITVMQEEVIGKPAVGQLSSKAVSSTSPGEPST